MGRRDGSYAECLGVCIRRSETSFAFDDSGSSLRIIAARSACVPRYCWQRHKFDNDDDDDAVSWPPLHLI